MYVCMVCMYVMSVWYLCMYGMVWYGMYVYMYVCMYVCMYIDFELPLNLALPPLYIAIAIAGLVVKGL